MAEEPTPEVYQLHIWIRQISPMIGRRLLVRSDHTEKIVKTFSLHREDYKNLLSIPSRVK
jgi:hypothetical protein